MTEESKIELLRAQVKLGLDALERGAFTEVEDAELDAMLDNLASAVSGEQLCART